MSLTVPSHLQIIAMLRFIDTPLSVKDTINTTFYKKNSCDLKEVTRGVMNLRLSVSFKQDFQTFDYIDMGFSLFKKMMSAHTHNHFISFHRKDYLATHNKTVRNHVCVLFRIKKQYSTTLIRTVEIFHF